MIPLQVVQSIIIAAGNFFGILIAYWLLERRTDRKIMKYWGKMKSSEEGQDLFTVLKELKTFLKGGDMQQLMTEAKEAVAEIRVILKRMKERTEVPEEEDDEPFLPPMRRD